MGFYEKTMEKAGISAYYNLHWREFSMDPHRHQSCEIMYVHKGKCKIFADGGELTLKAGQLVFLEENVEHSLLVEEPCEMMNLEFFESPSGYPLKGLWQGSREARRFMEDSAPVKLLYDSARAGRSLRDLIAELERGGDPYLAGLLFQRMLVELSRCSLLPTAGVGYLRQARAYIAAHYEEDLRVEEVARATGISAAYLQTLFARYEKGSVMEVVHSMRLEKACFLLKNTRQSVTDIAFSCGYNSRQQFGYVFEKRYGKSPREYRRLAGGETGSTEAGIKTLENRIL